LAPHVARLAEQWGQLMPAADLALDESQVRELDQLVTPAPVF